MVTNGSVRTKLQPYLPRLTLEWLATDPTSLHRAVEGSVVFVDISGFTELSEKLARFGRIGAEEMADAINGCFAELLSVAYESDGSLLKFGGDALLLLFDGEDPRDHAERAARAAARMRQRLRTVGKLQTSGGRVNLRMSVGVHQGTFDVFLVGGSHRELLVTGPAATRVVTMEGTAEAGEIVVSPELAAHLSSRCVGEAKGPGFLLRSVPRVDALTQVWTLPEVEDALLRHSVPVATREYLLAGASEPEHRRATVAFIHWDGTDELLRSDGPDAVAEELDRLVRDTQDAAEEFGVCFLASDVDGDGGKLILTAGVPRVAGEDEERMLLTLRRIVDAGERRTPIRIGVNQGPVFSGDVGPSYRRTYTVMGDAVNLAARLMAKAPPGRIYASASVLDASATRFQLEELEPFMVKGKSKPVQAWSVGAPIGSRSRDDDATSFPFVGRQEELRILMEAVDRARGGSGTFAEIRGEAGIGKSRLVEEVQAAAPDLRAYRATAEAYTSSTPYVVWRELLRECLGVGWEDPDDVVIERLLTRIWEEDPSLEPWAALIAIALDVDMAPSLEVELLAPEFRRAKLHEAVRRFLDLLLDGPTVLRIDDGHVMDSASADLLTALVNDLGSRPWLIIVSLRPGGPLATPEPDHGVTITPKPLDEPAARALALAATAAEPLLPHQLALAISRADGNPQFLLDLVSVIREGALLPDSVEAAAVATIDRLTPADRTLVRRASVLGVSFHPRFLEDLYEDPSSGPDERAWSRLSEFFESDTGGYVRFRRAVVRDAAYAGLPFRTRRAIHAVVAERLEREVADEEEAGGLLSLHFFLAGRYREAWHYARIAARRASSQFASEEAAQLHRRAIDSGRRLPDVSRVELAVEHEALADALLLAGEYARARDALSSARRLARDDDFVWQARLLAKRSRLEERLGRYPQSLAWATRARRLVDSTPGADARRLRADLSGWRATVLQAEGRTRVAVQHARQAVAEAEEAGNDDALGAAYFVMGWAYGVMGIEGGHEFLVRSLEAYRRSGDLVKQADLLSNLGVVCQWDGRWDEAMEYWERGRVESERIGDVVGAAVPQMNIAEVLIDRGELGEAERLLLEILPLWRASQYTYFLGYCLGLLGRLAGRAGRLEQAIDHFTEAKAAFLHVGAEQEVLDTDARLAECYVYMGRPTVALDATQAILERARTLDGVAVVEPLLERVRGYALTQLGDRRSARDAFAASLRAGRARRDRFETMLTSLAIVRLARLEGIEPSAEAVDEAAEIIDRLRITAVPTTPLVSAA